jgi:hypothetical protein
MWCGGIAPPFLKAVLDAGAYSFSRPGHFTSGETAPDRRLGGPHSQSGRCGLEKNLAPGGNRTLAVQLVACRYPTPTLDKLMIRNTQQVLNTRN